MMGIKARILKIIPVSVYQDKVYTQDIIIEHESGQKLALSDYSKRCKDDFLGRVMSIEVIIPVAQSVEVINGRDLKIIQEVDDCASLGTSAELYCLIEDIVIPSVKKSFLDFSYAVINVGIGDMLFYLSDYEVNLYKKDDYLHLINGRLDVWRIEPE